MLVKRRMHHLSIYQRVRKNISNIFLRPSREKNCFQTIFCREISLSPCFQQGYFIIFNSKVTNSNILLYLGWGYVPLFVKRYKLYSTNIKWKIITVSLKCRSRSKMLALTIVKNVNEIEPRHWYRPNCNFYDMSQLTLVQFCLVKKL